MSLLGADFRRDLEIRRYPLLVYTLVPLLALVRILYLRTRRSRLLRRSPMPTPM